MAINTSRVRINFGPDYCGKVECDICFRTVVEGEVVSEAEIRRVTQYETPAERSEARHRAETAMRNRAFERGAAIRARKEGLKTQEEIKDYVAAQQPTSQLSDIELRDKTNERNRVVLEKLRAARLAREEEKERERERAIEEAKKIECAAVRKLLADSAAIRAKLEKLRPKFMPLPMPTQAEIDAVSSSISFAQMMQQAFHPAEHATTYVGELELELETPTTSQRERVR